MHLFVYLMQGSIVPEGGSSRLQSVVMTVVGEKQCERSYFSVDITPQSMVRTPSHGPPLSHILVCLKALPIPARYGIHSKCQVSSY